MLPRAIVSTFLGTIVFILFPYAEIDAQPVPLPSTPQGKIVAAYFEAFNNSDENAMREFILNNIAETALAQRPVDDRMGRYRQMREDMRSLLLRKVNDASEKMISVVANTGSGEEVTLAFEFESAPPGKLVSLRIELGAAPHGDAVPPMSQRSVIAAVKKYMLEQQRSDSFSGVVLIAKNGAPLFKQAYGMAEKRFNVPNALETKFNLGSINKLFTRIATAQLVEQGKLSFTDTLNKILPAYPNGDVAHRITIQQLLDMTSGLGDFFGEKFDQTPKDKIRTLQNYLQFFVDKPLEFEPGSKKRYSNAGFLVLGLVIDKLSGQEYYDYVREHIYSPAGMKSTDWYETEAVVPGLATGYMRSEGKAWRSNVLARPARGSSAGGGYSTAGDLLKFVNALQKNKLLSPPYTAWVLTGTVSSSTADNKRQAGSIGIAGGTQGANAILEFEAETGTTIVVLSNYDPPSAENVGKTVRGWVQRMK